MSIPKNHHYVSQCHIKNFFNNSEKKIYLYDKEKKNIFERKSTKRVFSEYESNSKITDNKVDHESLELDLKEHFEDNFVELYKTIIEYISNSKSITPKLKDAIIEFAKYGVISEIRTPFMKSQADEAIKNSLFNQILPYSANPLKEQLEELKVMLQKTKYSNSLKYSDFSERVIEKMGDINFIIYVIKTNDFFILPDCASITWRARINEYFNPDIKEISMVGIPLSSKVFLHVESKKLRKFKTGIIELNENNVSAIRTINFSLYKNANKQVACENKSYLTNLIEIIETE